MGPQRRAGGGGGAFFCLAVWPPMRTPGRRHIVAPYSSSVTEFVPQNVLEPVESFRETIDRSQQIFKQGARDRLAEGLSAVKDHGRETKGDERSLLEFLFPSVGDLIETPKPKTPSGSSGDEIIRF